MDRGTQENAALVEEATSAAAAMTEQAQGLVDLVAYFRTGQEVAAAPAKKAPPPRAETSRKPAKPAPRAAAPVADSDWKEF